MILRRIYLLLGLVSTALLGITAVPATSTATTTRVPDDNISALANEYLQMRSFPSDHVPDGAFAAARAAADATGSVGGSWREQTTQPYNAEPAGYNDPIWSNAIPAPGAGFSIVGGRVTAIAVDGATTFAGGADGGVWKRDGLSGAWRPIGDGLASLSIGALAVNPADHSLWVGTGEANTNGDSYQGTGVYRLTGDSFQQVGGKALVSRNVYQLTFDGVGGVYAATNRGLFKTSADGSGSWTAVLMPDAAQSFPPYTNHITTVVVAPGSGGKHVVAVDGWRGGTGPTPFNNFFESLDGGATFNAAPPDAIAQPDIGRTSMAYGSDGRLFAVVESPIKLVTQSSNLQGVFVSPSGNAAGPWKLIANETTLQNSGSALSEAIGFPVGVQAWYNNVLAVNPSNPDQLYVGLEEVFQTNDGGKTWHTASPYWNFGLACNPNCPNTTHPDQHALAFSGGNILSGNDGGVYLRPISHTGYGDWSDTNDSLHNLQDYDARAGMLDGQLAFWSGMQDNGSALLMHTRHTMIEPAGGDGFDVIVDPNNANRAVGEYVDLATYLTTDGGHTFRTASPSCVGQSIYLPAPRPDCDNGARFWAPFASDSKNINNWIGGGQMVWNTSKGWDTRCDLTNCDWKAVFDLGAGHHATAVAQSGATEYAAWVNGSGNPGTSGNITVGIATNFGGSWHQVSTAGLPKRFIAGVTIDDSNPAHVYAIFNGYSRRWIPDGGQGVVFESKDGGATWTDISGNLPDAPGNALVTLGNNLVVATDVGVFTAQAGTTSWSRLGTGLPNVSVNNVHVAPDGMTVVAGTHGRGIWTFTFSG